MKRYTILVEKALINYSAYVPDLPGCVTTGSTVDEVIANMHEAIAVHLETMQDLGIPVPEPTTSSSIPAVDALALHAEQEYRKGRTRSLRDFANENDIQPECD